MCCVINYKNQNANKKIKLQIIGKQKTIYLKLYNFFWRCFKYFTPSRTKKKLPTEKQYF